MKKSFFTILALAFVGAMIAREGFLFADSSSSQAEGSQVVVNGNGSSHKLHKSSLDDLENSDGSGFDVDGDFVTFDSASQVTAGMMTVIPVGDTWTISSSAKVFGTPENYYQFLNVLKPGGSSNDKRYLHISTQSPGRLYLYARSASSSDFSRNMVVSQNSNVLLDQIMTDEITGSFSVADSGKVDLVAIYRAYSVDVQAGVTEVTFPNGGVNFYGVKFVSTGDVVVDPVVTNVDNYNLAKSNYPYATDYLNQDITSWNVSDFAVLNANEHWNGYSRQNYYEQTSSEYNRPSWVHTANETVTLSKGKYMVSITGRAAQAVTATMSVTVGGETKTVALPNKGNIGYGIDVNGNATASLSAQYANYNQGYGWEYRFIEFEVTEAQADVTISLNASASEYYSWISLAQPMIYSQVPNTITLEATGLSSWTSENHDDGSSSWNEWEFNGFEGGTFSFDWAVSSESGCDRLVVQVNGTEVLNETGERRGTYSAPCTSADGKVKIRATYTKDGSVSHGTDNATISNFVLTYPTSMLDDMIAMKNDEVLRYAGFDAMQAELHAAITSIKEMDEMADKVNGFNELLDLFRTAVDVKVAMDELTVEAAVDSLVLDIVNDTTLNNALANAVAVVVAKQTITTADLPHILEVKAALAVAKNVIDPNILPLINKRAEVIALKESLEAYPGMQAELQQALDAAAPSEENSDYSAMIAALDKALSQVNEALNTISKFPELLAEADQILSEGAYVEIAEAVEKIQNIDAATASSSDYQGAYNALIEALSLYYADQVAISDWAFATTVYTVDGLRYNLDQTHGFAKFIGFNYNSSLTELNIPAYITVDGVRYSVVSIANQNHYEQPNIKSVSLPRTLRRIEEYAFYYYRGITSLEIPANVEQMDNQVFYYADNMKTLKMNSVVPPTVNGDLGGNSQKKIYIPAESFHAYRTASGWQVNNHVLIAGDGVALSTGKLSAGDLGHVVVDDAGYIQEVNKLVVEGTLNNDDWTTIKNMTNLIELDMSGVVASSVPASQFQDKWAMEKIVLPSNLTTIGNYAFRNCGAQEVKIPETLTTVGSYAFYGSSIKEIYLPATVTSISNHAFRDCGNLEAIVIPEKVTTIPNQCFWGCYNLKNVQLPQRLATIESNAFYNCTSLTNIVLPEAVGTIGEYAFYKCPLQKINIPAALKNIGYYVFAYTAIDSLFIPATAESIGEYSFSECKNLKSVEFSEGFKSLNRYSFSGCTGLTEVVLPSTLETCANTPFNGCSNIKNFEVRSVTPPTTSGYCPLSGADMTQVVLKVPSWSVSEYKLADGWNQFLTVEASDFMPKNIVVKKDFYFTLRDTLAADYRPNITMTYSDVQSSDSHGNTNFERGNMTISGRSKLAVNNLSLVYSAYAKYYSDENLAYNRDYDYYRTNINSTSLIVKGEMRAENVTVWLTTSNNRWQFISFPFDVDVADIIPDRANVSWVIRKHNGAERAAGNVNAAWQNMNTVKYESLAQPKFSPVATDGNTIQYLYNVETGTFVIGANEWNTRASVSPDHGYQFKTRLNADGAYTLTNYVENQSAWKSMFADDGQGIWVDNNNGANANGWMLTMNADSTTYTITNPGAAGNEKLGVSRNLVDTRLYLDSTLGECTTWAFVNQKDYNDYLLGKLGEVVVDTLRAGQGYIMHTYHPDYNNSWFAVSPIKNSVNRQLIFASGDRTIPLEEHLAEFDHNRSWNLIGNPYPSFYDTRFMDFDAPFMVWNSYNQNYVAYNPADDKYILSPGEAFFVQRPFEQDAITFRAEGRQTDRYARELEGIDARRATAEVKRELCNIVIAKDSLMDRTRVVFNNVASTAYEVAKDATKFASMDAKAPQIFTVEGKTRFAINERPILSGDVQLGVYCGSEGEFTISLANAFNGKVILEDKFTGSFVDITSDAYIFNANAGEYLNRFVLHFENEATGIKNVEADDAQQNIYNLQGIKVNAPSMKGVYIQNGKKSVK